MSTWAHVSSDLGKIKTETYHIAEEIYYAAQNAGHDIWFMWGMGTSAEHKTGLALDLMVRNEAAGDWVRDYIWSNRERLRLHHVIWEQHITSTTVKPGERVKMADRGNPTANHMDHNHVLLFPGEYRAPAGTAPGPSAPSGEEIKKGSNGDAVRRVQQFLSRVFPVYRNNVKYWPGTLLVVDGSFGGQTEAWVKEFQRRTQLPQTGVVDDKTLAKMSGYGYKY